MSDYLSEDMSNDVGDCDINNVAWWVILQVCGYLSTEKTVKLLSRFWFIAIYLHFNVNNEYNFNMTGNECKHKAILTLSL